MKKTNSILFTLEQLRNTPAGRMPENAHLFQEKKSKKVSKYLTGNIITKVYPQDSKEKMSIEYNLFEFSQKRGLILYGEYYFHPTRLWRFDWCIPDLKLAVEFEGIISEKSRHTTLTGYTGDTKKYNEAVKHGWRVWRYTAINYTNITDDLKQLK